MDKSFYVGSCRYMYSFKHFFPPRLHSTKEVINYLLKNLTNSIIYDNNEFGDICHPAIAKDVKQYFVSNRLKGSDYFVMELSTKKVAYKKDCAIPYSAYYTRWNSEYTIKMLTEAEIRADIQEIKRILKEHYGINTLVIIPHINLPLKSTGKLLSERDELYRVVLELEDVHIIDITKNCLEGCYLEDVLPDGTHYSREDEKIVSYIRNYIEGLL